MARLQWTNLIKSCFWGGWLVVVGGYGIVDRLLLILYWWSPVRVPPLVFLTRRKNGLKFKYCCDKTKVITERYENVCCEVRQDQFQKFQFPGRCHSIIVQYIDRTKSSKKKVMIGSWIKKSTVVWSNANLSWNFLVLCIGVTSFGSPSLKGATGLNFLIHCQTQAIQYTSSLAMVKVSYLSEE